MHTSLINTFNSTFLAQPTKHTVLPQTVLPRSRKLANFDGSARTLLADGTQLQTNHEGRISQIEYPNGSIVHRHELYVMVRDTTATYWFGNGQNWYRLD